MRTRRFMLVLGLAFSLMLSTALLASAHSVYVEDWVYASDTNCTKGRSEVSHGDGGGYVRVDAGSWYYFDDPWFPHACGEAFPRSAWKIRAKYTFLIKDEATGNWNWCVNSEWYYNQDTTSTFVIEDWPNGGGPTPPCGNGNYATSGGAYVENGGTWYGEYVWAGQHWLP